MKKILGLLILLTSLLFSLNFVFAQENKCTTNINHLNIEELRQCQADLEKALNLSISATRPLEGQLNSLRTQINGIKARVSVIEQDLAIKRRNIEQGYKDLAKQKEILNKTIRKFYIESYNNTPLLIFLSANSASELTQVLAVQKAAADQDKLIIINIALSIHNLETKSKILESEQIKLAVLKKDLDEQSAKIDKIVSGAKAYQGVLSGQIAKLSQRQQEILGQRLANLNLPTTLGAGPLFCTDDRKLDPGFGSGFAFFTFGIPHRVGMNQYGAFGRANAGQGHEDILRAYFEGINFEQRPNINIKVQGFGEMPLETYLLGIYEMPDSWPMEALKAQAIAARSYALSYTNNGANEICTTQACQVYKGGNKGGNWEQAVRQTEGKVAVNGGAVVTAWYASTAGGYTFNNEEVWGGSHRPWTKRVRDTTGNVGGISDLQNTAFDKDSPCFYSAQGFRRDFGKSAWLRPSEIADIVNTLLLVRADSSVGEHLYQTDKPNPAGTDNWDEGRVKDELRKRGITSYNSVSDVTVSSDFSSGQTSSVTVLGDAGSNTFISTDFKNRFNLRAPANIQIVGPLFNVERR